MIITPGFHFCDQLLMPQIKGLQATSPAQSLRMPGIAFFPKRQNRPDTMKLPVLPEQVVAAQQSRLKVPDPHLPAARLGRADHGIHHLAAAEVFNLSETGVSQVFFQLFESESVAAFGPHQHIDRE